MLYEVITIPEDLVTRTLTLVMLAALLAGASIFCLLAVQLTGHSFGDSRGAFMSYVFEAISAFATVGLSLGATAKLVPLGKVIVMLLMFVGRVGLLTMAFTFAERTRQNPVVYAEENIMIG